jgi:hypothetical protein
MTSIAGVKLRAIVRRILQVEFQTSVEPFHLRLDQKKMDE